MLLAVNLPEKGILIRHHWGWKGRLESWGEACGSLLIPFPLFSACSGYRHVLPALFQEMGWQASLMGYVSAGGKESCAEGSGWAGSMGCSQR